MIKALNRLRVSIINVRRFHASTQLHNLQTNFLCQSEVDLSEHFDLKSQNLSSKNIRL
ncbi:hypothetical protein O9G_002687 [Rozella allomycis CSF55]|uniref:Uncharacterized protein n=1 Tax=Rozella allomycis (strain CSF55) TaxID=988480 RepID=A0A075B0E1_ROZAC|nr:hypothetical protein O9G_002687 [Rozella allomycis CSF55]|eukprot:EPZ36044.1 hypothetical protein O9G_002687 [Rozella allomycis CSF55]